MQKISPPKQEGFYPDRGVDLDMYLEESIFEVMSSAAEAGWTIEEIEASIIRLARSSRAGYEMDPDPADDPDL